MIVCLVFAIMILCSRCTNDVYLYVLCCHIRIPQSPALYVLFSIVHDYAKIIVYLYLFIIVYATLEMTFYISFICNSLGGTCLAFAVPHYGTVSLFVMSLIITCFIRKRVAQLDKGFDIKTIRYFYPDNVRRMGNTNIECLKSALEMIRMIVIYASLMYIAFNNTGLILIGDWDKMTQSFSLFFQFQGLVNDKGLDYDSV
eukprot:471232_1